MKCFQFGVKGSWMQSSPLQKKTEKKLPHQRHCHHTSCISEFVTRWPLWIFFMHFFCIPKILQKFSGKKLRKIVENWKEVAASKALSSNILHIRVCDKMATLIFCFCLLLRHILETLSPKVLAMDNQVSGPLWTLHCNNLICQNFQVYQWKNY